ENTSKPGSMPSVNVNPVRCATLIPPPFEFAHTLSIRKSGHHGYILSLPARHRSIDRRYTPRPAVAGRGRGLTRQRWEGEGHLGLLVQYRAPLHAIAAGLLAAISVTVHSIDRSPGTA